MHNSFKTPALILLIIGIICCNSCMKNPPVVTTKSVSAITPVSAVSGGNVTGDGGAEVTAHGVCWDSSEKPTINSGKTVDGKGNGSYDSDITGLTENTTYYVRAYATNSEGTGYGNQIEFTTRPLTDIDGNNYKTVKIGSQVWMAENLKTTRYNDGTPIPDVTDDAQWSALTDGGYCWNNNDIANKNVYGALYNWYTVATNKLCPAGWHVPSDNELQVLYITSGMSQEEADGTGWIGNGIGGKLKEAGTIHWAVPNEGATDQYGFTALPGGVRYDYSQFSDIGSFGAWWSSTVSDAWSAYNCILININSDVCRMMYLKNSGLSVRCLKDQ
jgi:uncharacterized protein (TIGR02145 family)